MTTTRLGLLIAVILGLGALIPLSSEVSTVSLTCSVSAATAGQPTDLSELDVPCVLKEETVTTTRQYYGLMSGSETTGQERSGPLEMVAGEIFSGATAFPERQLALCVSSIETSIETQEEAPILTWEEQAGQLVFTCVPLDE